MCGPLTANVSLRCMASNSDARVFSSAHTPVRPAVLSVRESKKLATRLPDMRTSGVPSVNEWPPKKLSCRYGTPVLCESDAAPNPNLNGLMPRESCIASPSFSACLA